MAKKTTPEGPPSKKEASLASKGLRDPEALTKEEIRTIAGRLLSEENRRSPKKTK